mgnify:CR=1 FL=1
MINSVKEHSLDVSTRNIEGMLDDSKTQRYNIRASNEPFTYLQELGKQGVKIYERGE